MVKYVNNPSLTKPPFKLFGFNSKGEINLNKAPVYTSSETLRVSGPRLHTDVTNSNKLTFDKGFHEYVFLYAPKEYKVESVVW